MRVIITYHFLKPCLQCNRFEEALQTENEMLGFIGNSNWSAAYSCYEKVKVKFDEMISEENHSR